MGSIIDQIAQAEAHAEQIRQDAAAAAKDSLIKARAEAAETMQSVEKTEREATRAALEQAEREGEALSAELLGQMDAQAEEICAAAEARVEGVVSYIIEKVRSGK